MSEFADWHNTPWTEAELAAMGIRSAIDGGRLFCAVNDQDFAIGGVTHGWRPGSRVSIGLDFSSLGTLTESAVREAVVAVLAEIHAATDGIKLELINSATLANIFLRRQKLDGSAGVLADCQIPTPGAKPDSTQLRMRFDDSEAWVISEAPGQGQIDFYRVFAHELLHGLGLGHAPANIGSPALIAPTYSRTIRGLQEADKAELRRRYGAASAKPAAPAPAVPAPGSKGVNVTIEQDGKRWSGSVPRVA